MSIKKNLLEVKSSLPANVELVAVSKTKSLEEIMTAYKAGQRVFGENKIQEMTTKWESLPKDIQWHMIGHVQTNKVKHMAEYVSLIHGVDSIKLLSEINKQAAKNDRIIDCLLQVHIAEEESKFGLNPDELSSVLEYLKQNNPDNIRVVGLMGMATFTDNEQQIEKEFLYLKSLFDTVKKENPQISILSMGMSGDYKIAVACGSTMVRVGSSIFGSR